MSNVNNTNLRVWIKDNQELKLENGKVFCQACVKTVSFALYRVIGPKHMIENPILILPTKLECILLSCFCKNYVVNLTSVKAVIDFDSYWWLHY